MYCTSSFTVSASSSTVSPAESSAFPPRRLRTKVVLCNLRTAERSRVTSTCVFGVARWLYAPLQAPFTQAAHTSTSTKACNSLISRMLPVVCSHFCGGNGRLNVEKQKPATETQQAFRWTPRTRSAQNVPLSSRLMIPQPGTEGVGRPIQRRSHRDRCGKSTNRSLNTQPYLPQHFLPKKFVHPVKARETRTR